MIKLGSQIVMKMCSGIDDINDIKEKNAVANDVVIFINTMKEYIIQDVLKLDLNDMMECIYDRPSELEIPDSSITMLTKCTRSEYNQLSAQTTKEFNLPKSLIPSHYQMTKDQPEFTEHELIVENVGVESEAKAELDEVKIKSGVEEVKIKLPVLLGHLEGGYTKAINIMMDKLVAKGLVDEESKQEKLSS